MKTLMCTVETLSSSGVNCARKKKLVLQDLQVNGYPKGFSQKYTCLQSDQKSSRDQETRGSVTLPYISGLPKSIQVVSPPSHPGHLLSLQDTVTRASAPQGPSTSKPQEGSVVYNITCFECPHTFIGPLRTSPGPEEQRPGIFCSC